VQPAAGGAEPVGQAQPSGVLPEPAAAFQPPLKAGVTPQDAVSPTAAGGYIRMQRRHKKRRR